MPKYPKSPCSFQKTGCSFHSFEQILSKRAKNKSPKNLDFSGFFGGELGIRTLGTFLYTAFRVLHLRPLGQLSVYVIPHFFQKLLERTDGKNNKIFNFRTGENPVFMGFFSGANGQLFKKFRVSPVMTTSIRLRIICLRVTVRGDAPYSTILRAKMQEPPLVKMPRKNKRF